MLSNTDLSFHAPAAGLVGVDPAGAGNSSMFSRLHLVGNPDWLPSFSSSQQVVTARPVLVPPVPVASAPRPLAAPAAIDAPAPAAKGFFSMFYRASAATPSATAEAASVNRTTAGAPAVPAPPKALDALNSPPQRAMPVDAHLSLEHFSKSGVVEASMPAVRREPPRPLALGSDTWNAFSSVAPLPTTMSANGKHVLSPPAAIDGVVSRAPKPLWSDLSFTSRFRNSAPTLDAFRNVAAPPTPITTSPEEGGLLPPVLSTSALPVPPKPVTTSPLRDTASSLEAVASQRSESKPHPLVPVGEDALPVTPLLKPAKETTKTQLLAKVEPTPVTTPALPTAEAEAPQAAPLHHDGAVSPVLLDFVKSIAEPATQQEQKEEAAAAANVRNFLSTLFSRAEDAEPASTSKADAFNALELAINRGGTQPKTTQPLAYSTFASSPLFMDSNDEDSEEGLERLRRVVSIVMQSAKASESCNSQPSSQTQRRNGNNSAAASPAPGKYTEFSAIYHTTNNDASSESEWMQYARF
jgi:hypothetical protein